jgi:hypothetical protein
MALVVFCILRLEGHVGGLERQGIDAVFDVHLRGLAHIGAEVLAEEDAEQICSSMLLLSAVGGLRLGLQSQIQ